MSLDCFGKVLGKHPPETLERDLLALAEEFQVGAFFEIDEEDATLLESFQGLGGEGVLFGISDQVGRIGDATGLWVEAFDNSQEVLSRGRAETPANFPQAWSASLPPGHNVVVGSTRLAGLIRRMMYLPSVSTLGIALVDGCIDRIVYGSRSYCLDRIIRSFSLPWDLGPNALYVAECALGAEEGRGRVIEVSP